MAVGSPNNPSLEVVPGGHWLENTQSTVAGVTELSLITPFIYQGERLRMTDLDAAALDDIGWEPALAGDTDRDRDVDFDDAFTLTNSYGMTGSAAWSFGDFDNDGDVDFDDAFLQVNNYGAVYASTSAFSSGGLTPAFVPEPSSLMLLVWSIVGLAGIRSRLRRI
jgi:hypothetical protein